MRNGFPDSRDFWGIIAGGFRSIGVPTAFFGSGAISGAKIGLIVALLIDLDVGNRGSVGLEEPGGGVGSRVRSSLSLKY